MAAAGGKAGAFGFYCIVPHLRQLLAADAVHELGDGGFARLDEAVGVGEFENKLLKVADGILGFLAAVAVGIQRSF